jgi:hypothetical protein
MVCTVLYLISIDSFSVTGSPAPVVSVNVFAPGGATYTSSNLAIGGPLIISLPVGVTNVSANATNASGVASCNYTITVVDTSRPAIVGLSDITVQHAFGTCSADVAIQFNIVDFCSLNNDVVYTITNGMTGSGFASGGVASFNVTGSFQVGTTNLMLIATDGYGNFSQAPFTVTVLDNEPPTIPGSGIHTETDAGSCTKYISNATLCTNSKR